jgi:hypothetical protein
MTEKKPEHKNIGEAWLAIMNEVGYVQKKGVNTAQKYKYAGEAQLIDALRPELMKHGVICVPGAVDIIDASVVVAGVAGQEKKTYRVVAKYTWVYTHVPSNTHMQVEVIGEGVDTGDKAAYKAATGALKYALRQPFLIETGDEPEAHDLPESEGVPVFKNAALRNTFCANVIKSWEACENLPELIERKELDKAKLEEMKVGSEHDQLAAEELKKRYILLYKKYEEADKLHREADMGNFG